MLTKELSRILLDGGRGLISIGETSVLLAGTLKLENGDALRLTKFEFLIPRICILATFGQKDKGFIKVLKLLADKDIKALREKKQSEAAKK